MILSSIVWANSRLLAMSVGFNWWTILFYSMVTFHFSIFQAVQTADTDISNHAAPFLSECFGFSPIMVNDRWRRAVSSRIVPRNVCYNSLTVFRFGGASCFRILYDFFWGGGGFLWSPEFIQSKDDYI